MKKKDFTPESIHDELLDYTIEQNFPHDALIEIGSNVRIEGLSDIQVDAVKKSGSNFVVDGRAMVETETDLGEGDSWSESYPMKFSYEFDEDGKIVKQRRRQIDTSSFFAGNDDYETYLIERSGHRAAFEHSILAILSLLGEQVSAPDKEHLHRLLYVNVITVVECYLSDFFISRIQEDGKLRRKLIETTSTFKEQKIAVSDVFGVMDAIEKKVNSYLAGLVWHRLDHVNVLYKGVLGVSLPSDMNALRNAIAVRHELVHRNGKKQDGTEHEISETDIRSAIKLAEELVDHIEDGWLAVSSAI